MSSSEAAEGQGENKKSYREVSALEFISCSRQASYQGTREKLGSCVLNTDRCTFPASLFQGILFGSTAKFERQLLKYSLKIVKLAICKVFSSETLGILCSAVSLPSCHPFSRCAGLLWPAPFQSYD